jgi:hypothetical protein
MNWQKTALFLSGLFFGGAIDHMILAVMGSNVTPYGLHSGIWGNWALASLDMSLTVLLYLIHRRLEKGRQQ